MRRLRLAWAVAAGIALAGCGNDTTQPKAADGFLASIKAQLSGAEAPASATPAQIKAAITPEVRAANGNKPLLIGTSMRMPVSGLLVMAGQNGAVRTYLSPDGISFSLRNGVLVATRGLGMDLMSADVSQVLPRVQAGSGRAVRTHQYLDGENRLYSLRFDCSYSRSGGEVVESCSGGDVTFQNRYTLRGSQIAVSVQWVNPPLGSYRLEDLG